MPDLTPNPRLLLSAGLLPGATAGALVSLALFTSGSVCEGGRGATPWLDGGGAAGGGGGAPGGCSSVMGEGATGTPIVLSPPHTTAPALMVEAGAEAQDWQGPAAAACTTGSGRNTTGSGRSATGSGRSTTGSGCSTYLSGSGVASLAGSSCGTAAAGAGCCTRSAHPGPPPPCRCCPSTLVVLPSFPGPIVDGSAREADLRVEPGRA